jgi:hypothetical protein
MQIETLLPAHNLPVSRVGLSVSVGDNTVESLASASLALIKNDANPLLLHQDIFWILGNV